MLFAKIINDEVVEWPLTEKQLRAANPNIDFPKYIAPEHLEGTPYVRIEASIPTTTLQQTKDKKLVVGPLQKSPEGTWIRTHILEDVPEGLEKDRRIARKWKQVREKRDSLMAAFEWRVARNAREVALGIPLHETTESVNAYMQALADITKTDDPFLINWPEEPTPLY